MPMAYPHVAARLFGPPLAMRPTALKAAIDGIGPRLFGLPEADAGTPPPVSAEDREPVADALRQRLAAVTGGEVVEVGDGMAEYALTPDGVAVIPITGSLVNRFDWLSAMCGMMSYDTIGMALDAALADPRAKAVLLDVDSPGGEASGMLDLADSIRAGAAQKPIWAVANPLAASAAYGLAAAASRLVLPRLATVGSIGVVAVHVDRSEANAQRGLTYTAIYSGAQKVDGWQHAPLGPDAKDRWQADIDQARSTFAAAVAGFRGMTVEQILATEAATYDDQAAVTAGLADAVQTFDEALAELSAAVGGGTMSTVFTRGSAASPKATKEVPMADQTGSGAAQAGNPAATAAPPAAPQPDPAAIRAAGVAYAAEISSLCLLAGKPGAATEFVAKGMNVDQVRDALLGARSAEQGAADITTARPAEAASAGAAPKLDHKGIFARFNGKGGTPR